MNIHIASYPPSNLYRIFGVFQINRKYINADEREEITFPF